MRGAGGVLPGHSSRHTGQQPPGSSTFTAPCGTDLSPCPRVPPPHQRPDPPVPPPPTHLPAAQVPTLHPTSAPSLHLPSPHKCPTYAPVPHGCPPPTRVPPPHIFHCPTTAPLHIFPSPQVPPTPHTWGQLSGGQWGAQATCPAMQRHIWHRSCHSLPAWPGRDRTQLGTVGCTGVQWVHRGTPHARHPPAPLTSWTCPRCQHGQRSAGTQWPVPLR